MSKYTPYVSHVVETEDGELCVSIPEALMKQMGWAEETLLEWEIMEKSGQVKIKKVDEDG